MVSSIERFHCIQDSQLVPMVSSIERFHCIQDSQLGPNGDLYREVPLYVHHKVSGCTAKRSIDKFQFYLVMFRTMLVEEAEEFIQQVMNLIPSIAADTHTPASPSLTTAHTNNPRP